ncbi:MAG: hypothetical protein GY820_03500 [Gammaproteobacteria bacterium]|nr:hypothetical protein [Gammaproteobacteria bacterium]
MSNCRLLNWGFRPRPFQIQGQLDSQIGKLVTNVITVVGSWNDRHSNDDASAENVQFGVFDHGGFESEVSLTAKYANYTVM